IEQPAVEWTAQAAVLEPPVGKIGAAMRTFAFDQPVAAALVAEQHQVLAQQADRLDRPVARELVDQRGRVPIVPHQSACGRTRAGAGDKVVLLGAQHAGILFLVRRMRTGAPRVALPILADDDDTRTPQWPGSTVTCGFAGSVVFDTTIEGI